MNKRVTSFYVETLILIIVFVAVILALTQVFGLSKKQSEEAKLLTGAVTLAQNAAEAFSAADSAESLLSLLDEGGNAALEGGKVDVTKFKTDLGQWFPEVYNTDGTAMHDVAKEAAAMTFPEDDFAPAGNGGLDMDSTVNFGGAGEMGDLMDSAQEQFGPMGGMDAGEMNAGIDMSENGNAAEGGGKDKTDLAIESLDNLF